MFTCQDEFSDNIDELIQHLKYEEEKDKFFRNLSRLTVKDYHISELITGHLNKVVKPSATSAKEFTYTNSIISLYGYLESFIEKLSDEFATSLNDASLPIDALPEVIRKNHLDLSVQYLAKVARNPNRDSDDKRDREKEVISNLHSFLQESEGYKLNSAAFAIHTANFRYHLIQAHFSQLGVERIADRTLGFTDVVDQLAVRQRQDATSDKDVLKSWLELELGELAQLRNEIAHGAFGGSIESIELLIERAEFIKCFGVAMGEILFRSFEDIVYHGSERFVLGKADKAFPKQNCFGFEGVALDEQKKQVPIRVGDEIFAKNNTSIVSGLIKSLRLNGESVDQVMFPSNHDFAIKVDFDVSNNMTNRELSIFSKA